MKNVIISKQTLKGILIKFRNKRYLLNWPKEIWKNYPNKELFINNYVPLATISLPLLLNLKKIKYNLPKPEFHEKYKSLFLKDLPSSTFDNKQDAIKLIKKFNSIQFIFENKKQEIEKNKRKNKKKKEKKNKIKHKAVISLSLGKDSLLSFSVAREINLNPITMYINDTVSPTENKGKIRLGKKFSKEFKQKHFIVKNSIEQLNDFETWNKPETNFNYSHIITGFSLIALPFAHYYNSRYIIIGNEQDMNFSFKTWQGLEAWPAYDQTSAWQEEQNKIIKELTNNKTEVTSIIRPLTNIAIIKILYKRYPKIAKYEFSCDCLDASNEKRWCHNCSKCARHYLFMKAFNINTKIVGLRNMFDKKYKHFYCLFNGKKIARYEQNPESREQQLLAFLLATRHKVRGYLIDYFKKHYMREAIAKEDELRKKYFSLWPAKKIPKELKKVLSIYKEELKDLR